MVTFFYLYVPSVECLGGQLVSINDLVGRSDYIILATVLVPETMYIINKDRLALMKPNAVIINVGRGSEYSCYLQKQVNSNI